MKSAADIMTLSPVIPVLVIDSAETAVPLARALLAGGLRVLEVTLRSDAALASITAIAKAVPEAVVGAGTVLNAADFKRSTDAGARFIVSPGITDQILSSAKQSDIPLLAGVATAGEIMRGLDAGLAHFKFFPAQSSGGAAAVKAFAGPFAKVRFCPTGGITPTNARDYLALDNVLCVGGSWLAPEKLVANGDWKAITQLASEAAALGK
ncbi:MAG TPA: bifunctional 4-hydroxy-2-oxoglutarate aldolase/2-dehydro-3-deoxy-phosphogluconate aldolase [Rhizomicrobium sp.]|nr:bifunctional 4-hydroxy-2-oxoglutarate aldolase/2-dehydro-3-deoxy-phosphogluconate aldolase [Rhizomicrobium sp.]